MPVFPIRKGPLVTKKAFAYVLAVALAAQVSAATADSMLAEGRRAYQRGAFDEAASKWQKAAEEYGREGKAPAQIEAMIDLATAYQALGQQRRAVQILETAAQIAGKSGDRKSLTLVKSRLGAALLLTLQMDRAEPLLRDSLKLAREHNDSQMAAAILNEIGNLQSAQQKHSEAISSFRESAELAGESNLLLGAQALCNAAATAARATNFDRAENLNAQALKAIQRLEASHDKALLLITAAQTDRSIQATGSEGARRLILRERQSLVSASEVAEAIGDRRASSYALGYLGQLYEQDRQLDAALSLTRRAAFAAQETQMPEALYRWEWQAGRILKGQGKPDEAIAAYRRAVQTLQPIRHDITQGYGNATARRSFRDAQGPMYFEVADLLFAQADKAPDSDQAQRLLREARDTVEQLKAVELEDYFRDDCVNTVRGRTKGLESVDERTAIIYLVPFAKRTEMLVGLASGMKRVTVPVGVETLTTEVRQLRRNLETRTTYGYLEQAEELYGWLIRPVHQLLSEQKIDTLVFVPDGALRTIPFASLYDGKQFLIQEFAVAVAPGLSLVEPRPIERKNVHLLLSGLSEGVQGFPPLDFVPGELKSIEPLYRSVTLLNQEFVLSTIREKLTEEQYSIVHIASHGQFGRDASQTFVLTHDSKLTLNDLEAVIRPGQYRGQPVEMLVLSACQTAAGDDRAALGLAGVAVKAGARSALATLWFVNDQSTSVLVTEVYSQLRESPGLSKAKALQAAQIKLISDRRYRHPCYWSPYLIIGNWL
jgi:CHAT domain-containing protein/lipopolysaccharide biosynthesis regulator YciM